ncbi:LacI family DNA-binding transcriptional regulator [Burkholderia sp. MR1-5-21]
MNDTSVRQRRKRTPRLQDIAEEAGVSLNTVDRVLNERDSVSAATRARVIDAAKRLGITRLLPQVHHSLIHLDVVLPRDADHKPFYRRLRHALQRSVQMLDKRVVVHRYVAPEDDESAVVKIILNPPYPRRGLIITAHDTPQVRAALQTVISDGEHVITMSTDIGGIDRLYYAGIDNYRAGRTAGHFIGRLARRAGRVLILCSTLAYRSHVDRTTGCRNAIAEGFPSLHCDQIEIETDDDPDRCYKALVQVLSKHDDIVGIYNSGAGSPGIDAALRKYNLAGKIVWVTHEMSDDHRTFIEQGTLDVAIDQDPESQVFSALQHMLHACGVVESAPMEGVTEFRLFCAENVRRTAYLAPDGQM